jgi:hypothetical protein
MGKLLKKQPSLFHMATAKDVVYTPQELARDMVAYFQPSGICLDPCAGDGVFYNLFPEGREWCEIERGRDFYAWQKQADWIISNPPYSDLLSWVRHSFKIAKDIVYIMPSHRVFASAEFLDDLFSWGGIVHIRRYGTGSQWGFPFGHALAAVHYRAGYTGSQTWSRYEAQQSLHLTGGIRPANRVNLHSKVLLPPSRVLHPPRAGKANR